MADVVQGFTSLMDGMNAGMAAMLLPETQYAFGLNVSSRGGAVHTRPPFAKLDVTLGASTEGRFQGGAPYRLHSADRLVCVIAGRVLGIRTDTLAVTDYSDQAGTMDPLLSRLYFCQVDKYMIVQDGTSQAMIIDGDTARRANQVDSEVPIGTIMAYGHGRLFVVPKTVQSQDGRRFFLAGDIILPTDPSTVLKFTETQYLASGGAFALPNEFGFISGMIFMRNASTGVGLGALVVFAQHGVSAFAVNAPRSEWPDIDISQVLFQSAGANSPRALATVNNDVYFRGLDGIRSLQYSIQEISQGSGGLRNAARSREVTEILQRDRAVYLPFVEMAVVGNRLFCTSVPSDADEPMFDALVVLDADVMASINQAPNPIWDGAWTGLKFMSIMVGRHHSLETDALYVFAKNDDDENELHMLDQDGYVEGVSDLIPCRVYTRAYNWGNLADHKEFRNAQLDMSGLKGTIYPRGFYRPYGHPCWAAMNEGYVIEANPAGLEQRRQSIRFSPKDDAEDPILQRPLKFARQFEFCLQWVGYAQIDLAMFKATIMSEPPQPSCEAEEDRGPLSCLIDLDPFGPWTAFDPFIPEPDFVWPVSPGYYRIGSDGRVTWSNLDLSIPSLPGEAPPSWSGVDITEGSGNPNSPSALLGNLNPSSPWYIGGDPVLIFILASWRESSSLFSYQIGEAVFTGEQTVRLRVLTNLAYADVYWEVDPTCDAYGMVELSTTALVAANCLDPAADVPTYLRGLSLNYLTLDIQVRLRDAAALTGASPGDYPLRIIGYADINGAGTPFHTSAQVTDYADGLVSVVNISRKDHFLFDGSTVVHVDANLPFVPEYDLETKVVNQALMTHRVVGPSWGNPGGTYDISWPWEGVQTDPIPILTNGTWRSELVFWSWGDTVDDKLTIKISRTNESKYGAYVIDEILHLGEIITVVGLMTKRVVNSSTVSNIVYE